MAVIVRQSATVAGRNVFIDCFLPQGGHSAEEREQARQLDVLLSKAIPALEGRVSAELAGSQSLVRKWYLLGASLREIISRSGLVRAADVDSGDFWKAVWWYLPRYLRPEGRGGESPTYGDVHKRKDHLSLCYEVSAHPWQAVSWLQRWDDWHQISFRPTISRDPRILAQLGASIGVATRYPTRSEFRAMVKALGDRFPTQHLVNTEVLSDRQVIEATCAEVTRVIGDPRNVPPG